jgi:hypothetical protein
LGTDFTEEHWYILPRDLERGKFAEIYVSWDTDIKSKNWPGWKDFENKQPADLNTTEQ